MAICHTRKSTMARFYIIDRLVVLLIRNNKQSGIFAVSHNSKAGFCNAKATSLLVNSRILCED